MDIPTEILDLVTFCLEAADDTFRRDANECRRYKLRSYKTREILCTLRLVSKAFCHSASPRLFQHIDARFRGRNGLSRLLALREISRSPYASHVRHLDIGIDCKAFRSEFNIYAEQLAQLLPTCLAKFLNLSSLDFIYETNLFISHDTKDVIITSLANTLHTIPLPNLTELDLSLPLAYDFGHFIKSDSPISINTVLKPLRHLGLHIKEYTSLVNYRDGRQRIDPQSASLPNEKYAMFVVGFAKIAENVESLAISSTNVIYLDTVSFLNRRRLKCICPGGISVNGSTFIEIMKNSEDLMTSINLIQVELHTEMWEQILQAMEKLPNLVTINLESCAYAASGENSGFRPTFWPARRETYEIETLSLDDIDALVNLLHQVNINRKSMGLSTLHLDKDKYIRAQNMIFGMDDMAPEEQMDSPWGS